MLKYHKNKSRTYKEYYKSARKIISKNMSWGLVRGCWKINSRRRMKLKARRWEVRYKCYECQQEHLTPGLVEHVEKKLGIHLEAQVGYHPIDEIFPDNCRECRFIMRGGQH